MVFLARDDLGLDESAIVLCVSLPQYYADASRPTRSTTRTRRVPIQPARGEPREPHARRRPSHGSQGAHGAVGIYRRLWQKNAGDTRAIYPAPAAGDVRARAA